MDFSWHLIHSLEETYGDSFYLLDPKRFQDNYNEFQQAFRRIYPNTRIAYSYKTNYTPKLCQLVNSMEGYAEVVSRMEYDLALRVGVPPQRIIFNGPYKRETDIEAMAKRSPDHTLTVGIRCNFDIGTDSVSRYGFDAEGEEFKSVFETLGRLDNCRVGGLHCHFLAPQKSAKAYSRITRKMLELTLNYFGDNHPQFIDVGGGFFSKMSPDLRKQFGYPVPTFEEYAQAIAPQFAAAFPRDTGPELILEPGIAITADIMKFVAKVIDIKTVRSRTVALVSGSVFNIKPTLNDKNLPIQVLSNNNQSESANGTIDIVGYTCMENDRLYKGYTGPLDVGDYIVFDNVGAYTIVLKPPFIMPCPAMIAYDSALEEFEIVKQQESSSDVFSTFIL